MGQYFCSLGKHFYDYIPPKNLYLFIIGEFSIEGSRKASGRQRNYMPLRLLLQFLLTKKPNFTSGQPSDSPTWG